MAGPSGSSRVGDVVVVGGGGGCLPGAHPARYFSINYPDFNPRSTLSLFFFFD